MDEGLQDRVSLDLENAKAVLMKLINIETTVYAKDEHREKALIELVRSTNKQKKEPDQSDEAKETR